ncbi:MAG: ferredoxin family protein [Planctomycetes bacterium]|nr:ferredoxin family protein [Planctomycetota bacterium]
MKRESPVIYCHCAGARLLPEDVKNRVLRGLAESGRPFEAASDLCGMAARRDPELSRITARRPVRIAACFPRAVRWILSAAGIPLGAAELDVSNLREESAEDVLGALARDVAAQEPGASRAPGSLSPAATPPLRVVLHEGPECEPLSGSRKFEIVHALLEAGFAVRCGPLDSARLDRDAGPVLVLGEWREGDVSISELRRGWLQAAPGYPERDLEIRALKGLDAASAAAIAEQIRRESGTSESAAWRPWFPVIDYDRCTGCMQCLSFCLFDVYGVDERSRPRVVHPEKCKTNCPACSRVCPEIAIIFPKYKAAPINGAEISGRDLERDVVKADISTLLGGNIYRLLRERNRRAESRFSRERDESRALQERLRCLREIQNDLDIPPEVLGALPSYEEIEEKARKAREAAERALRDRGESPATRRRQDSQGDDSSASAEPHE